MRIRCAFPAAAVLMLAVLIVTGCDRLPGRPGAREEVVRPEQVLDFDLLYKANCSGCHGAGGRGGPSIALRNPVFLAIADDATIQKIAAGGVAGTQMTAFAQSNGGVLTDRQIDVLVHGIRAWAVKVPRDGLPPFSAQSPGDPRRGADVFATFCASCHGAEGRGSKGGSAIVDGAYLALVSDQYLRSVVIAGRPELGAPDWRGDVADRFLTSEQIDDVVAWLASHRSSHTPSLTLNQTPAQRSGPK
jgi:cytochrome c oxidase cbb3-type subunit 3